MEKNILRNESFSKASSINIFPSIKQVSGKIVILKESYASTHLQIENNLLELLSADISSLTEQKLIKAIDQSALLNKINCLHFTESTILVFLEDSCGRRMIRTAKINRISENNIICRWMDCINLDIANSVDYQILNIGFDDGKTFILITTSVQKKNEHSFSIYYPQEGWEIIRRCARRYLCLDIKIKLSYKNINIKGVLIDFNAFGIRVQLPFSSISVDQFNQMDYVNVEFFPDKKYRFSSSFKFIRQDSKKLSKINIALLSIDNNDTKLYTSSNKKYTRNPRLNITPAPFLIYKHPLLKQNIKLKIQNISSSGICVYEENDEFILLPGMIISESKLIFNNIVKINCSLRVVYRLNEFGSRIKYGLSILDIDINSYNKIMNILTNTLDPNVYLNFNIEIKKLWEFFFKVNFIYHKKYHYLGTIRKIIQSTYIALYQKHSEIAMHLTYQKNETIYGHFSALHAYENTWVQHHHAAKVIDNKPIGFLMLKHLIHYFKDMHRFPSLKTNYLMGYYRPENKFPEKVFGGFYNYSADRKKCSLDLFAYIENQKPILFRQLPKNWLLRPATEDDLKTFTENYERQSGGLFLEAIGIDRNHFNPEFIETLYKKNGFFRKLRFYALCYHEKVQAFLFMEQSNPGLNLSNLLNNIKIFLFKPENTPWKILSISISQLIIKYRMGFIPVLIFPVDYTKLNHIQCNKQYQLWICRTEHYYRIVDYLENKFRLTYWN